MEDANLGSPSQRELQWREYQMSVDMYKFYVAIVVKAILSYYAITGAILTFYFAQTTRPLARWALVLPSALGIGLAVLFRWGADLWQIVRNDAFDIARDLRLKSAFELSVVSILLNGGALLLLVTGVALISLIIINP